MLYDIAKPPVAALLRLVWKPGIEGAENVPEDGPAILASNHLAYSDTVILPAQLRRTVHFLGKSDIFAGGSPVNAVLARMMRGLNVMPVDRSGGRASATAIEAGLEVLRAGDLLGIYPEGTRSPDGRLYRGKTGVARFALATGAPIIPVAMLGSFEAQRGRRYIPRRSPRIRAVLGAPVDAAAIAARLEGAEEARVLRAVTDEVMERIREISGQEQVDEYAADVKRRLRAEAAQQRPTG
ncbi:lysophospholipid acyltransferase family protein [Brachybacterium sp. DNPG3]